MSALPPKADICRALANVSFGPIADMHSAARSLLKLFQLLRSSLPLNGHLSSDLHHSAGWNLKIIRGVICDPTQPYEETVLPSRHI